MSEPNDETKVLAGFLAGFLLIGILGWHGCSQDTRQTIERSHHRHTSIQACLSAGGKAHECKDLGGL